MNTRTTITTKLFSKHVVIFIAILFASVINHAQASESEIDKFRIALGGYSVTRYDSTMSLTDAGLGAGVSIDPGDAFGLQTEQTVLRLDGHYRFNKKHALTYSWYSINANGNKTLDEEVDWIDENGDPITIPIGASIDTILDYDIYKVGYLWSFHHTDKVELAVGAGLHVTRVAIDLSAGATYVGNEAKDVKTTMPLPVFSFALSYNVTPKFTWYLKSELFALSFDEWDGVYTDATLAMEYRAFKHVGFGLGAGSNALKLRQETSDYNFTYDNRITGVMFYVAGYF